MVNTEFGKLIGSKPDEDRDQIFKTFKRKPERKFEGGTHATTLAMQTQKLEETEQRNRFPTATKCLFSFIFIIIICQDATNLETRHTKRERSSQDRISYVITV